VPSDTWLDGIPCGHGHRGGCPTQIKKKTLAEARRGINGRLLRITRTSRGRAEPAPSTSCIPRPMAWPPLASCCDNKATDPNHDPRPAGRRILGSDDGLAALLDKFSVPEPRKESSTFLAPPSRRLPRRRARWTRNCSSNHGPAPPPRERAALCAPCRVGPAPCPEDYSNVAHSPMAGLGHRDRPDR